MSLVSVEFVSSSNCSVGSLLREHSSGVVTPHALIKHEQGVWSKHLNENKSGWFCSCPMAPVPFLWRPFWADVYTLYSLLIFFGLSVQLRFLSRYNYTVVGVWMSTSKFSSLNSTIDSSINTNSSQPPASWLICKVL